GRLVIGFDGASKGVYEEHRVRCSYERVLDNIRAFVMLRQAQKRTTRIAVQYVRTRRNVGELADAWRMFGNLLDPDLDCFNDNPAKDWGDAPGEEGLYILPKLPTPRRQAKCGLAARQLLLNSDGTAQACPWDYNLSVSDGGLGDASYQTLDEIWR